MTQAELFELARLLNKLGAEVNVDKEETEAYLPNIGDERSFYLPKVPRGFYYDPGVFRRLLGIK